MKQHIVAIFGGAVSGAEAAYQLAQRGIESVVFEQNALPFGKIEDGLPKWHTKLRDKEESSINEKLENPLVTYVPLVRLGEDVDFLDVTKNWGFSAVLLATGAWRDRPLQLDGIEDFLNHGFYYQNQFIKWYNHCHEPDFRGNHIEIKDGALVIGGGLASIDIAKALMMEMVQKAVAERGARISLFDLERGIPKALEAHNLKFEDLGLKGCTLVYRRRIKDMPLFPGENETPEQIAKAEVVREKVVQTAQARFLFHVLPCHIPVQVMVDNGKLVGLVLKETTIVKGEVHELPNTEKEFKTEMVVSSIGSIPELIPGLPAKGQVFDVETGECCRLRGYPNVFALGNAVTGRGNIKESLEHGRDISQSILEQYLFDKSGAISEQYRKKETRIIQGLGAVLDGLHQFEAPDTAQRQRIMKKVKALWCKSGYNGNYTEWIKKHTPMRIEQIIGH